MCTKLIRPLGTILLNQSETTVEFFPNFQVADYQETFGKIELPSWEADDFLAAVDNAFQQAYSVCQ